MVYEAIKAILNYIWPLLNSVFGTSIIGAFAGAYGGSLIVERGRRKESTLIELRRTNAAVMATFNIVNTSTALKKQHVRKLVQEFDALRSAFIEHMNGTKKGIFHFRADLQSLDTISVPIDVVRKTLFEEISVGSQALALGAALSQAINNLNTTLLQRNQIVEEFRNRPAGTNLSPLVYFGIEDSSGHTDYRYASCIQATYQYLDDCIFFSDKLCSILTEHGKKLSKSLGQGAPKAIEINFDSPEYKELLPEAAAYDNFMRAFSTPN